MADVVQYRLERMTDELNDLERRGIFSRAELDQIVSRRRDFEFRIKRPSPLKQGYLSYIEFESNLDSLRDLRKRKIIGEMKEEEEKEKGKGEGKKGKKWKRSVSDVAGVLRILGIYRLATMRYKGDLDLWFRYLEFCRERKHGRMKEALAQAIRYHPKVPGLWIYAAAWEFDQNLNVTAARALMQSGLRANPNSQELWIEYLRMELTYLNKLRARRSALGQDLKTLELGNKEIDQWKEENKDLFMGFDEREGENKGVERESEAEREKVDMFWKQGLMILRTVCSGAVEAIPESFDLRRGILEILNGANLGDLDGLKGEVMGDMKRDFSKEEGYWDWLAGTQFGDGRGNSVNLDKLNEAVQIYEEALEKLPTEKMFSLYAKFYTDILFSLLCDTELDQSEFTESLVKLYQRAELNNCLSEGLACNYVSFYVQIGKLDEARELAERLLQSGSSLSESVGLWEIRVSVEMKWKMLYRSEREMDSVFRIVKRAVEEVPVTESEGLWIMALKYFSNNKDYFEKLSKLAILSHARSFGKASIPLAFIGSVLQTKGFNHARDMYKRFLSLPRPSLDLFKYCIELELNLASIENYENALGNARKLYESALGFYSQDKDLWRNYYAMEMKFGTSETANAVYWRARKILKDSAPLSDTN